VDEPALPWAEPRAERADAARNRLHLLATAREMLAGPGADKLTMDALAERAGLGKGTVFRRFGTRAGIFQALLDDDERAFQAQVLSGPPPLGPGAAPVDRLIAYGRARAAFMTGHREIARAALGGSKPVPTGSHPPMSQAHIRVLLGQLDLGADPGTDLDMLAVQLTAALDGPLLLYLSSSELTEAPDQLTERIARAWQDLIQRVCSLPAHAPRPHRPVPSVTPTCVTDSPITEIKTHDNGRCAPRAVPCGK
jgi:AcrR family transcriptional regulator